MSHILPDSVARLCWDVDPASVDLAKHRDYVMERVMSRGDWDAMGWLRETYDQKLLADFLVRRGSRLTARDEAYWCLIAGVPRKPRPRGGQPPWAA